MALTTSPGLVVAEAGEPTRLALIAVPVLRGIVTAGPCWTGFFSGLLVCPMVPPASAIARSATPIAFVFIGGLLLRAGGQTPFTETIPLMGSATSIPICNPFSFNENLIYANAAMGSLWSSGTRFLQGSRGIFGTNPVTVVGPTSVGATSYPVAYDGMIPSGLATSARMSAALTSCSFLCPALTIARNRAFPSAPVG